MPETTIETREAERQDQELSPLTLTILAHPQLRRLGQQCVLRGKGPFSISRSEPSFHHPGEAAIALDDPHISRKPVHVSVEPDGAVLSSDQRKAKLGGELLGIVRLAVDAATLDEGVILTLGSHVALLIRRAEPAERASVFGMVGPSPQLQLVQERIRRFARGDQPVLVRGPTGTGKELVARAIHDQSPRASGPWVSVNLAAIPATTAASQLFGHTKGAFTGAGGASSGLFGAATAGSLFLDEIGEVPEAVQPLLLRALESGEVQVVGGRARIVDVRLIAATDADLDHAIASGRFRSALYHRLGGSTINLAPLRERPEDIAAQLHHFVVEQLAALGREDKLDGLEWLSPHAQLELIRFAWPGNTRQLRRTLEAMVLDSLELDQVRVPELLRAASPESESVSPTSGAPGAPTESTSGARGGQSLDAAALERVLAETGYRLKPTAERLEVSVNTLKSLMKRHGFRRAKELSAADIDEGRARVGADVHALASELRVSAHALRLRLRELG